MNVTEYCNLATKKVSATNRKPQSPTMVDYISCVGNCDQHFCNCVLSTLTQCGTYFVRCKKKEWHKSKYML